MMSIVTLSSHHIACVVCYLVILSSCVTNYVLADSEEHASDSLYSYPGAIQRSSAYVTGCHCNCTTNNGDELSNIGFFPCQSFGCIQCAPTDYDVCVYVHTDSEGNQEYGMYVCLANQQDDTAMCLHNLPIPYFICEKSGSRDVECKYERGNEESLCTFTSPSRSLVDGCYPIASSCPDSSGVCCERAQDCNCLADIFSPSSDICLQRSIANGLWGSCSCETPTRNSPPVCGACGECKSPLDGTDNGSSTTQAGGGGNMGGFEGSNTNQANVAGIVVPIVIIIILIAVGVVFIWRNGGVPQWMRKGCSCKDTGSLAELPVKRAPSRTDEENAYEIEANEDLHFYAGVEHLGTSNRSQQEGPLTNATEDSNGYLWYRGGGGGGSSRNEPTTIEQNRKDPGDGLVYYELEDPNEKNSPKTDEQPEYLEFGVDENPETTVPNDDVIEERRGEVESQSSRTDDVIEDGGQYGKLDRSLNKSGHLQSHVNSPEDNEYGRLEPAQAVPGEQVDCRTEVQTYQSLDRGPMKTEQKDDDSAQYGQLDMTDAEQHTAPPSGTDLKHSNETTDNTRAKEPDYMPPSSEEVYGTL